LLKYILPYRAYSLTSPFLLVPEHKHCD